MREIFFGTPAVYMWATISAIFLFGSTFVGLGLLKRRDLEGLALFTNSFCNAVVAGGFAVILSHQTAIPPAWVGIVISTAFYPIVFSLLVLVDLHFAVKTNKPAWSTALSFWVAEKLNPHKEREREALR